MLDKLGAVGVVGLLLAVAGIAVVAVESLIIAGGLALVLVGLGVTAFGLVKNLLGSLGMGAML
jgi:hypothetical protein